MKSQGLSTATFTAAVTDLITSNSHGLQNGDRIILTTTTTLPAGLELATVYYVINATTNTFKVALTPEGPVVDITGTGTGTHTWTESSIGKNIFLEDFQHAIISVSTSGSANMTLKFQGSIGKSSTYPDDSPDFSAARSQSNVWDYVQIIDMQSGLSIDGDTGIAFAGVDDTRQFEVNINALRWLNVVITAWSAGDATIHVRLYNDR